MTAAPRLPVPSDRQLAQGHRADDVEAQGADASIDQRAEELQGNTRPRRSLRTRAADLLRQMNPGDATKAYGLRPVVVMSLSGVLQGIAAATFAANFLTIRRDLAISDSAIIGVSIFTMFLGALTAPFLGELSDHIPRLHLAVFGCVAFAVTTVTIGVWPSFLAFLVIRASYTIFGLSWGSVTSLPLLADYYPPEVRGRIFAIPQSVGSLGGVIGPLIGGLLGVTIGWQAGLVVTGILAGAAAIGYLTLKEPSRGRWDRMRLGVSQEVAEVEQQAPSLGESWRAAKSIGTLRRIWYAEALMAMGGIGLTPLFLLLAERATGGNALVYGILIAASTLSVTAGLALGGTLVDVLVGDRPGRVMVVLGLITVGNTASILILATVHQPAVVVPILLVQPFVNGLVITSRDVLVSLVVPARLRAFGLQLTQLWKLVGVIGIVFAFALPGDPVQAVLLVAVPLMGAGAVLYLTASADVERDIDAARQAAVAEEEMAASRREGRAKLLVCRKVDVHYDGVQVLFDVDFDVEQGELVALLGTNGAGKSTLLRAISGLTEATGGAIFLDGRDITHAPAHELARFGVVQMPGGRGVFPTLTVDENLRAAAWLDPEGLNDRLERVFALFPPLRPRRHQLAGSLSGGEQQMVALGQAFLMRPKLLLIDELSLGLAPAVVEQLLQAVQAVRDDGATVVLVEQSVNLALTIADRAVFMEKGEVRFSGAPSDLLQRPDIVRSVYLRGSSGAGSTTALPASRASRASAGGNDTIALDVDDIWVHYGGVAALRGASLEVHSGEIVGVIGPNGAGKTTLFDAISGFVAADRGTVLLAGKDVTAIGPDQRARQGLGRSFQDGRLFQSLTVLENIAVALQRRATHGATAPLTALWLPRARAAERRLLQRAEGLVELLGLGDFRDKFASELSTGSRRVVDLACVMAAEPEVVLLDEPSSGIAQAEAEELAPLLDRVRRELGCGMLVIEHDMKLLTTVADRLVGMVLGETIVTGTVDEVTSEPVLVEAYLGTSQRVLARSGPVPSDPARESSTSDPGHSPSRSE